MADITSKMLDVRIGTSNDWAQENLSLVAGNLYYVDLMKNDGNPSGAMALFLAMGTTKADARYLTTLMPSALDASVTGDVAVGDTLVTALSKLNNKITSVAEDAAKMFTIRGTIGTEEDGGDRQGIPPTAEKGDAWRIVTRGDYSLNEKTETLEVGDWIICSFVSSDNTPTWVVLQANLDLSSVTFDGSDIEADGFVINLSGAGINASATVPFADVSKGGLLTAEDYGRLHKGTLIYKDNIATATDAGVVMVIDATDSDKSEGYAATPTAVKSVKVALDEATKTLTDEQKAIVKGIEVDNATHSTDSKKILVLDEAGQTFYADVHILAEDEGDNAGIRLHTNDISNKVIVNEADHSALADNLVVEDTDYSVKAVEIEKKDKTKEIRLQSTDEKVSVLSVDHADLADDLGGRQETTPEEFIYQPTAGEYQSIKDGMASIKSLKGNSVVWNQKYPTGWNYSNQGVISVSTNGLITLSGTVQSYYCNLNHGIGINDIPVNHKGLYVCQIVKDDDNYLQGKLFGLINRQKTVIINGKINYLFYTNNNSNAQWGFGFMNLLQGEVFSDIQIRVFIIDLTQMFQEGNEPTTIEEFNARKPRIADEYAYNEGEIISFNGDAIKSVGFNQWDEEWEVGKLNFGNKEESVYTIRSKNYIRVLAGVQYALNKANAVFMCYDENYNFIEYTGQTGSRVWNGGLDINAATVSKSIFTFPQGTVYTRFYLSSEYGTTYKNDICINLSHTGFRNGEYEPYTEHTLYLPREAQDMKFAGTAYDEIYFNEAKKKKFHARRMGEVDLGDLDWNDYTQYDYGYAVNVSSFMKTENLNYILSKAYKKYTNPGTAEWRGLDKAISNGIRSIDSAMWTKLLVIKDSSYTDAASFKAAMKGVKLIYELAEPIITEITDYEGYMDYPVSDFGTEEILSLGNTAPLKAEIQYGFNAVDTIRNNRLAISDIKTDLAKNYYDKEDVDSKIEPINNTIDGILSSPMDLWGMNLGNGYMFAYKEDENGNDISPEGVEAKVGETFIVDKEGQYFSGTTDDNGDDLFFSCTIGNVLVCTKAGGQDAQFAMYDNYKDALYAIATKRIDGNAASIAGLSDEIDQANTTADEAKSLAENAEDYATQANNLSNNILDDIESIEFSATGDKDGVVMSLISDGITVGDGEGGYVTKGFGASVNFPKATSNNYGLMSPVHVDKLNNLYKPTAIIAPTTIGDLKNKLKTWLEGNYGKVVSATFTATEHFDAVWGDDTANISDTTTTWTAQVIAAYSNPNCVTLLIASYTIDKQFVVVRNLVNNVGTWGLIRQIAFTGSTVNKALKANEATKASKGPNGEDLVEVSVTNGLQRQINTNAGAIYTINDEIGAINDEINDIKEDITSMQDDINSNADDLDAIRSALTWKPFTNSSN